MSENLVDRLLAQAGARFTWRMTSQDRGLIAYGRGVVDFQAEKIATVDYYLVADEPSPNHVTSKAKPPATRTITNRDAIFVLAPTEDADEEWLAFETGAGGLSASVLAPLLWLRGSVVKVQDDLIQAGEHALTIDFQEYLDQLDSTERVTERSMLEFGRVGLSGQQINATIRVNERGLVERMTTSFPPGVSPLIPVGHEQVEQEIVLEWLPVRPAIPTPDAHMRVSAGNFIRATLIESGVPGWGDETE